MYQNRYSILFILATFFQLVQFSCSSSIEKENLKKVILEIHKCEAWNELKLKGQDKSFENECKKDAMKKLNISDEEMTSIMEYYNENSKEFEAMYDSVIREIETTYKQ